MNKFVCMGRLTSDADIRYSGETTIAKFSIAVDRRYKKDNETNTDFFKCVAFGKLAEFVEKYLNKGTNVVIGGRWENNNYTNKDGVKVYDNQIVVEEIEFAESKKNDSTPKTDAPKKDETQFTNIPEDSDDELPFN